VCGNVLRLAASEATMPKLKIQMRWAPGFGSFYFHWYRQGHNPGNPKRNRRRVVFFQEPFKRRRRFKQGDESTALARPSGICQVPQPHHPEIFFAKTFAEDQLREVVPRGWAVRGAENTERRVASSRCTFDVPGMKVISRNELSA
jgi:hypothetical protein